MGAVWLALLLLLALVHPSHPYPFMSPRSAAKPRLNGTFISLSNATALWSEGRWLTEFDAMTAVGIQFVVVHAVAYGTSDGSSGCPSGIPTLLRTNIVSALPGI